MTAAPGLKRKRNADGSIRHYWVARADLVKRGYPVKTVRLDGNDAEVMAARCRHLQAQMLAWSAAGDRFPGRGDTDTIGGLCRAFETDPDSPFATYKWNSQVFASHILGVISKAVGRHQVRHLTGKDFRAWHREAGKPAQDGGRPRLWRARHVITYVRRVLAYGVTCGLDHCIRPNAILREMRFANAPGRQKRLTRAQAEAFIQAAHARGLHSLALAQALHFCTGLRQRDVLGEWMPDDGGDGGIRRHGRRWANGVTWADIDAAGVLTKTTTKTGKTVSHDLTLYPMVQAELARVPADRRLGPLIVSEFTGRPWRHDSFGVQWRKCADDAGIPRDVQSRDSRAGAISEGYEAGATKEDMKKFATHSQEKTSDLYNRGSLVQTSRVAKLRLSKTKRE